MKTLEIFYEGSIEKDRPKRKNLKSFAVMFAIVFVIVIVVLLLMGKGDDSSAENADNEKSLLEDNIFETLEIYRDFLLGKVTANYQGNQITYSSLMCDIYDKTDIYKVEGTEQPVHRFALTDFDKDNVPELQVDFFDISGNGGVIYSISLENGSLRIFEGQNYGISESITMYKDGSSRIDHGLSATRNTTQFFSAKGELLAMFDMVHSDFGGECTSQIVQEDYERWNNEGYKYLYVTSDDICTYEEFNAYVECFALEYCGEVVGFYEVEESSIQNNLKWE